MSLEVEEIDDFESFLRLEGDWNRLCDESGRSSFFLSHAWFRCCWPRDGGDVRPFVLVVRSPAGPLGIVPLCLRRDRWRRFPVRVVALMENQDSPFSDLIVSEANRGRVVQAILAHLAKTRRWQLLSLGKIERSSAACRLGLDALGGRWFLQLPATRSPVLTIDGDWEGFWKTTSQRFKKTVRNVANRVERLGRLEVTEVNGSATPAECMAAFIDVAGRSWKAGLPISVVRNHEVARFFEELTTILHARGQLSLWLLRVDGAPVATEYHARDGDTVYALRSDFDDRYREASPGAHLNYVIIREYFERGVRTYDMGPGDSDYKQRWATSTRELDTLWVFNRTPYAAALYGMERRAVPRLRRAAGWWRGSDAGAAQRAG